MPIGLEVNDYDSEADVSSTEDDSLDLPVVTNKNKKLKTKRKIEKKSILKESKIVKDKAKAKIKNMETEINDLEFFDYLKEKTEKTKEKVILQNEIRDFFTDEELAEQLTELKNLEKVQRNLWINHGNSHVAQTGIQQREKFIRSMPLLSRGSFLTSKSLKKSINNSRTKELNTTSRVNTSLPLMSSKRIINRTYSNIGRMW